ncbi:family 20 glycosylhydrolase [Robertkochia solimangrovi]|uniref:family 20 glycosylhydrolase n=1 Tax=Robertkochia solimangrovi TaxID=2213046 RepID=UPI0013A5AFDD|nr:family 20 glycosylhydrolase [Robertkochia solimangrovi]
MVLLLSVCCKPKEEGRQSDLEVSWQLLANNLNDKNAFQARLDVINRNDEPLRDNWELFLNYSACRFIDTTAMSGSVTIQNVAGDFYRISPADTYTPIAPGDTLKIPVVAASWVIKDTDAPSGFYFILDRDDAHPLTPEVSVRVATNLEMMKRNAKDFTEVPTAESIYQKNTRVHRLKESEIGLVTPKPFSEKRNGQFFQRQGSLKLFSAPEFKEEILFLKEQIESVYRDSIKVAFADSADLADIFLGLSENISSSPGVGESYTLHTGEDGIRLTAVTGKGAFYGLQSLLSVLKFNRGMATAEGVDIIDMPRFSYRGLHLDVARNFQSKEAVMKLLDVMARYKLNKFHFHLTDDEGWRVEISGLPELTAVGGKRIHTRNELDGLHHQYGSAESESGSGFYSKEDYIEILRYARERKIEVIPEIDMPGHARAAIVAMKARENYYLSKGDTLKAKEYLLHDPEDHSVYRSVQNYHDNVVSPCVESTYTFLAKVVDELKNMHEIAGLPLNTVHTGGDEVPFGVWEASEKCAALDEGGHFSREQVKIYFLRRFSEILKERGLHAAGWEEVGLTIEELPDGRELKIVNTEFVKDDLRLYAWNSIYGGGGEELAYKLANAGYKVVMSNVTHLYFDMAYSKDSREPGFYWGGFVSEEEPFRFKPFDIYDDLKEDVNGRPIPASELVNKERLTASGKNNIMGIQGQLWAETVKSPERMEYMMVPKLVGLAERAWSEAPEWNSGTDTYEAAWNEYVNRLGLRELPGLDTINGGYHYRIPIPGAKVVNDTLFANIDIPGLIIRYTTDGSLPDASSKVYSGPVPVSDEVIIRAFNQEGRGGLSISPDKTRRFLN